MNDKKSSRANFTYECRDCGYVYGGSHIPSYRAIALHRGVSHGNAPAIVELRA